MRRILMIGAAVVSCAVAPQFLFDSPIQAIAVSIVAVCLFLWLSEIVAPFVPTLLLWAAIPLFLSPIDPEYNLRKALSWAADPVMALFLGGFVLGVATEKSGFAARLFKIALGTSGRSYGKFLFIVLLVTAFLSMWMSNIAAAALVLACLRPALASLEDEDILRRLLLVGVALGADFGGIATPIGTGPNAIAIASISAAQPISFVKWMAFALPLTLGMLAASYFLLARRIPADTSQWSEQKDGIEAELDNGAANAKHVSKDGALYLVVIIGTVALWLTEPIHNIPSSVISLAAAFVIFLTGILGKKDLLSIDWSTLLLIAGGITLGRLLEHTSVVVDLSRSIPFGQLDPTLGLFLLCIAAAFLAAIMSNTATAVLFIPLAMALIPSPSTAILIAIAASFGVPFMISTPPNAMAFGRGGVRFGDLFWPGLLLMIAGCAVISLTGPAVLKWVGVG